MILEILGIVLVTVIGVIGAAVTMAILLMKITAAFGEPASAEFTDKTTEMFHEVKKRHPKLKNANVSLHVKKELDRVHRGSYKQTYGHHMAAGFNTRRLHTIEIAEVTHLNDDKLYETICHELAHMLDVMERGHSGHDEEFHDRRKEIEDYAPKNEVM